MTLFSPRQTPLAPLVPRSAESDREAPPRPSCWQRSLQSAVRDPDVLIDRLGLPDALREPARAAAGRFPVIVPESFLARMRPGDERDPLLLQVLPLGAELDSPPGYSGDPLTEVDARRAPGMLQKYAGRALLIAAGACAVHCRYCFRREYPYGEEPRRLEDWEPALAEIAGDSSLREVILSGGDPLMLTDNRLEALITRLAEIPHLRRLRIHTRLPIVLPDRVTDRFVEITTGTRLTPIVVVHANHANELVGDCAEAVERLVRSRAMVLNQAVLLRDVNDTADALEALSERLITVGVRPYYLHQLDRVLGASHFEVSEEVGRALIAELRRRLPGYAVPQYVRETPGELHKTPIV